MNAMEDALRVRLQMLIKGGKAMVAKETLKVSNELDKIVIDDLKAQIINQSKDQLKRVVKRAVKKEV